VRWSKQRPLMPRRDPALEDAIREIAALLADACLRHMTVGQLKDKYRQVFGEETRSNHNAIAQPWSPLWRVLKVGITRT